jgi:hypothetical protein
VLRNDLITEDEMTTDSVFTVIVASYVSSEDAREDLSRLRDRYWDSPLSAYDAALLVTDAWGQVRVEAHTSQEDILIGPLHDAFTKLFGGPFVGGVAPPLPNDRRLPHKELLRIGDAMGPSSVKTVASMLGQGQVNLSEAFPRANAVEMTSIESTQENLEELASAISEAVRSRGKESSRNA